MNASRWARRPVSTDNTRQTLVRNQNLLIYCKMHAMATTKSRAHVYKLTDREQAREEGGEREVRCEWKFDKTGRPLPTISSLKITVCFASISETNFLFHFVNQFHLFMFIWIHLSLLLVLHPSLLHSFTLNSKLTLLELDFKRSTYCISTTTSLTLSPPIR